MSANTVTVEDATDDEKFAAAIAYRASITNRIYSEPSLSF